MFTLFIQMLSKGEKGIAEEILKLDDQLDKLYFFSLRTIKKNIIQRPEHYVDYVIVVKNLEHVGDAIDRATNYYLKNGVGCVEEVLDIFKKVHKYLQDAFDAFYATDAEKALGVLLRRAALEKETVKLTCPEATPVMEMSGRYPVRRLDYPEAYCIAVAGDRGYTVLSENGAAYAAQFLYARARVWRALEVLIELEKRGFIDKSEIYRYEEETKHKFPRRDLQMLGL